MNRAVALLCTAMFLACSGRPTADRLTDGHAKDIIETWVAIPITARLGSMTVVSTREPHWDKGEVNLTTFQEIEAWSKAGVVTLEVSKDLTQGFSGWNDWMEHWGEGVEKKIVVTPTDLGRKFVVKLPSGVQYLRIEGVSGSVHKIVQNEGVKKGADAYRVLLATYEVKYIPEALAFQAAMGYPVRTTEKKCRLLLKWDPFKEVWKVTGADVVDADREFSANDVFESILH